VSAGDEIVFDHVLAVSSDAGVQLGKPTVDGASVTAEVLGVDRGPKLFVQKFRKRKNSKRRTGHRQLYTRVVIRGIAS
jgi:large subunit ribosomal protein L21